MTAAVASGAGPGEVLTEDLADLSWERLVGLSPRPRCRVDTPDGAGGWLHRYRSRPLPRSEPVGPWALHLADEAGRYRLVCFDLDVSRGDVAPDLAYLCEVLDRAGAAVVVAESRPGGGRHVWVAAGPEGIAAARMEALARALGRRCPTLDIGLLCNPDSGAARPPGAPHRHGGRSRLLEPAQPGRALARLQEGREGWAGRLEVLLELDIGPTEPARPSAPVAAALSPSSSTSSSSSGSSTSTVAVPVAVSRVVVEVEGGPALAGRERGLSPTAAATLAAVPVGDCSAVLRRVLVAAALARWRWPRVRALLDDPASTPGLEHARSRREASGRRTPRPPGQQVALLARQWRRAVVYAATLPAPPEELQGGQELAERVAEVQGVIGALQAAAAAHPGRWCGPSGPTDRAVLDALCLTAGRSLRAVVALDVRRAAAQCGVSKSAAARGLHRLAWDGWIALEDASEGRCAARWRLLHPTGPTATGTAAEAAPEPLGATSGLSEPKPGTDTTTVVDVVAADDEGSPAPADDNLDLPGGTQGHPPPTGEISLAVWITHLSRRAELRTADLFCPRMAGGLGHHAASTAVAVLDLTSGFSLPVPLEGHESTGGAIGLAASSGPASAASLAAVVERTGYTTATVTAHFEDLSTARVAEHTSRPAGWRLRPERLVAAARARGVLGYHAERARVRAAESAVWAWWCDELAWLRAPRREQLPRGGQHDLWPPGGPRRQLAHRGRYPRRPGPDGQTVPDHATARALLLAEHGADQVKLLFAPSSTAA